MTDDIVARLRDGKNWLNGGACCGDVDDAECCAAPACIFGEALKQFYEAADEIERLTRERDWHKSLTQSHDLLADNAALKARATTAEAKVAKLRDVWAEARPIVEWAQDKLSTPPQRVRKIIEKIDGLVMEDRDNDTTPLV